MYRRIPIRYDRQKLIIGDRRTDKIVVAIHTILNQKCQNIICILHQIRHKGNICFAINDNSELFI